ncbi:MAG TPA: hypothetical protein VFW45_05320 [Candidatus Polarisedimenticolia bacterium]|nr:hypothetical protein [Candidatus Polarisedimenticolia bacterium]
MKRQIVAALVLISASVAPLAFAQSQPAPPSGQKTLAATLNVYAFPNKGQTPSQQSEDESACYQYAVTNTGTDPFQLQKQAQQQQQQSAEAQKQAQQAGKGAGAAGAVKGAAAGALIGEIASDDAGEGAAYGAAAGVVAGRRKAKKGQKQATEQAKAQGEQAQAATAEQMDNFKKAFSVCLEAKNYMVKY